MKKGSIAAKQATRKISAQDLTVGLDLGDRSELGHEVIVANARKLRLIGESRKKDDRLDAQTLPGWPASIPRC